MTTLVKVFICFIISQSALYAQDLTGQTITVKISRLNSNLGKVYVALYNDESTFLDQIYEATSATIKDNFCEVEFKNIPNGIYAISFFHDENNNQKMDSNFLGIPKEDYGCSNNARGFMGPPKWEDAKFELNNKSITQSITL